ncbi:Peptidase A1 domain-containing protein [Aphelenchoides fujianensis]|nr:Peptidase A1 domain-containing protein [Aphelenchoides fujianensis]
MDTMSGDLWVVDSTCNSVQCKGKIQPRRRFDCSKSKSCRSDGMRFLIEYNGHGVEGTISEDVLTLGDVAVEKVSFGRGLLLNQFFGTLPIDGMIGLGPPASSQTGVKTAFEKGHANRRGLHAQKFGWASEFLLRVFLFLFDGCREEGAMTMGTADEVHCETKRTFISSTSEKLWEFDLSKFQMGDLSSGKAAVVLDIQSDFIHAPSAVFSEIVNRLNATIEQPYGFYAIPCKRAADAPTMEFEVEGETLEITPASYIRDLELEDGRCVVCVADSAVRGDPRRWLLGNPFFRDAYCVSLDFGELRMGFAKQKSNDR